MTMDNNKTITEAQTILKAMERVISEQMAEYEQEYGIEFAYTAFVEREGGKPKIRLTAKL